MTNHDFVLAQLNIGRLIAPIDSPIVKEFTDFIDPINKFSEESKGFVWRLKSDDGQSSSYMPTPFEDYRIITNLTVWETLDDLKEFTYKTVHTYFIKSRRKWFEKMDSPHLVLWWIPRGHIPTLEEGKTKLELLEANGPTPEAFTIAKAYDISGNPMS